MGTERGFRLTENLNEMQNQKTKKSQYFHRNRGNISDVHRKNIQSRDLRQSTDIGDQQRNDNFRRMKNEKPEIRMNEEREEYF